MKSGLKWIIGLGLGLWIAGCGAAANKLPDGGTQDPSKGTVTLKMRKV